MLADHPHPAVAVALDQQLLDVLFGVRGQHLALEQPNWDVWTALLSTAAKDGAKRRPTHCPIIT